MTTMHILDDGPGNPDDGHRPYAATRQRDDLREARRHLMRIPLENVSLADAMHVAAARVLVTQVLEREEDLIADGGGDALAAQVDGVLGGRDGRRG